MYPEVSNMFGPFIIMLSAALIISCGDSDTVIDDQTTTRDLNVSADSGANTSGSIDFNSAGLPTAIADSFCVNQKNYNWYQLVC